jgi:hypothetical protein
MESLRETFFKTDRIHSFDVRCWTFISFFFDQTGGPPEADKLFKPAAGLNTETSIRPETLSLPINVSIHITPPG